jgi:hypothetical protein
MGMTVTRVMWAIVFLVFLYESYILWIRPSTYVKIKKKSLELREHSGFGLRGPGFHIEKWLVDNDLWVWVRRFIVFGALLVMIVVARFIFS